MISPGLFSQTAAADLRRGEFDLKNEVIITNDISVDYLFIGDSITSRWENEAYFRDLGVVINRGIGGDNSHYLKMRYEADAIQLNPKNIVLLIGVNDTMFLGIEYTLVEKSYEALKNRIITNIKEIIDITLNKGRTLFICSILPTKMSNDSFLKERNLMIREVNEEIESYCNTKEVTYVDYHSHFVSNDGLTLKDGYCNDGVHPNVTGYNLMSDILRNYF